MVQCLSLKFAQSTAAAMGTADKGVGGMVNGTGLTSESIARSGACGGGVLYQQ